MSWLFGVGISMSWLFSLQMSMSWVFGLGISMSRFFGLGISMSWFYGLGIPMSWYMCLHGLVFVIIVKTKKSHIIMSIMSLKNILIVQIYANLSAYYMHKRIRIIDRILSIKSRYICIINDYM